MDRKPLASLSCFVAFVGLSAAALGATEESGGLNCVILPDQEVEVGSPVPGVLEQVLVRRSDRVERGQVLARLESSVERATVDLARARAVEDSELELRHVELRYDVQHRDRLNTLHDRHVVSAQNLEDGERVAHAARLRVRIAEERRLEALLEQRRADAVLALKTIRSPIDGIVVQEHRTAGEYVEDQPIMRIVRLDPLRVEVIAPLALFGKVSTGMHMGIAPETDPKSQHVATVTAVDPVADPGSGTFGVELELPNPGLGLPAGIKCRGRLLPAQVAANRLPPPARRVAVSRAPAAASQVAGEPLAAEPARVPERTAPKPVAAAAEVAARPAAAAPSVCIAFEAIEDEDRARAIVRAGERIGADAQLQAAEAVRTLGYLVVSTPEEHAGGTRALAARLHAAGVRDVAPLTRGAQKGRLSLGAYNGPQSAERRRAALAELGFAVAVEPRTETERRWRVELRLPPGLEARAGHEALSREVGAPVPAPAACQSLRTAAL